MVKYHCELCIH